MNAETPTPSRASVQLNKTVEGVETMHPLPRPGKEIVRAAGKRTGRDGRNDHPLGNNTLIEMSSLRGFVQRLHFSPCCLISMLTDDARDSEEFLDYIQNLKFLVGHSGSAQCGNDLPDRRYSFRPPNTLWLAEVIVCSGVGKVYAPARGHSATKLRLNVIKNGTVVIALGKAGANHVVLRGLIPATMRSPVYINPDSAFTKEKAAKLCNPKWVNWVAVNILYQGTLLSTNSILVAIIPQCLVSKQQNCKDIQDELVAGVGTYAIPEGMTAQTFKNGFKGTLFGAEVYEDGNITITSNDAKGGVFAKEGIVLVQGRAPWKTTRDEPSLGGGGTSVWLWDEYAYGERLAGGTTSSFVFEVYSDATAPTS